MTPSVDTTAFLDQTQMKELIPANFDLKVLKLSTTVVSAIEALRAWNVTGCPVVEETNNTVVGFIDVIDLLVWTVFKYDPSNRSLLAHHADSSLVISYGTEQIRNLMDVSHRNKFWKISYSASLREGALMLSNPQCHRVAIVNEANDVVGFVSQLGFLQYLGQFKDRLSHLHVRVGDWMKLGTAQNAMTSINAPAEVANAFRKIWEERVSGLAVINDAGVLVGNISASNLRDVNVRSASQLVQALYNPISAFLGSLREAGKVQPTPIFVGSSNEIIDCVNLFATHHIHRIYVCDDNSKPLYAVSTGDIIKTFC